ncbi:MAG: PKD domain-containing protein, partial [Thermoanaerobaculia bacterium]
MNPSKFDAGRGRMRAAAGAAVLVVLSILVSTLAAQRAMGQCTLSSAVNFGAGNAPGAPIPTSGSAFRSGYENDVPLYTTSTGARRLLLMFNYGYGVMDLSSPGNPSALTYENMLSDIPARGDGQSYITSMGVAPDGARAVFSLGSQATPFKAAVGLGSSMAFFLKGDFSAGVATGGVVVQKTSDGRYIAYALLNSVLVAANATTLPTGTLTAGSMTAEATAFPGGTASTLQLAGNYLSYLSGTSVRILDASNPGSSAPNITSGFTQTKLSLADFGRTSGSPVTLATAVDPAAPTALYVLVEFAGSGFSLVRVQGSTKTLIGSYPIPTASGETWDSGNTSALITGGSNVYVFMWVTRTSPSPLFRLYSTTVSSFGSTPGAIDFDPSAYAFFSTGHPMRGFASSDGTVNAYMGMGNTAYALTLSCHSTSSPAAADMTVTNGATQLADGATVFLGDTITIKPVVNPPAAVKPITSWDFDFDFHAGVASEDNGTSATPRLRAPDNSALGGGSTPPSSVTLVGPCDPNISGTTPGSGAGCWNSVMQNSAFAGGSPDFTGTEVAGATKALSFAFEASNSLGSAGAKVFSLNWTVPAARLLSSQILLGNAISSGADGHPAASGFKWYFGSSNAAPSGEQMSQDTSCTGATCAHAFPAKGTFNAWLTVPYANGYTTPDCASPCLATGALKVTVTDVVLAFTAPSQISTSQANFSVANNSTVSSSVTKVGNGYQYCVKLASQTCQDSDYADLLSNGTGPIPAPGLGNYWLRIRFNYTIGGVTQPPAQWTPSASGVSDPTAWPFNVSSLVPEIRFNCTPGFGCTDVGSTTVYTTDVFTAFAYVNGGQDNSTAISWSAPGSSQGDGSHQNPVTLSYTTAGTYTLTLNGYGVPKTATITVRTAVHPPPALSVSASANPTSANTGTSITFSCSASGGTPGYTYSWSGSGLSGSSSSVSTSFSSAGNYAATCTVTDAASHTASATASVSIAAPGGGGG